MSLLDKLHAFIDPTLEGRYNQKSYDPSRDRAWVIKRLETLKAQFGATEPARGGGAKWWKSSNGVVAFSPTRPDKSPLVINGQTTVFIQSEDFVAFADHMITAVEAGEFDKELSADTTNGTSVSLDVAPRKPRARRAASEDNSSGRGWSDERRQRFAATIAARNGAKDA